ncbi:MAG TPA: hypothetical protein VFR75_10725 [Solirubrobacterales bacterium]|nr:hypothetical protein [Solirubrobacterales bacterium]
MKYVKILGLLAVAAAALMAFAGTASATTVTSPTGTVATPTIHAVNSGGKHVTLANPIANISCQSTVVGKVESHGTGVTAEGKISTLDFTECTNGWHVTTVNPGKLIAHWTSGYNGTLTSSGAKVDTTRFGITCVYETAETSIGTITGGNPAKLTISAKIPINTAESSGLCGNEAAKWEGGYENTSSLYLDH